MGRALNITALFAGIGGFELGLHRAGHKTSLFCENDREAAAVLSVRFPKTKIVPDVRDTDELLENISPRSNLLTAGFPCTDFSQAGRTQGFAGSQSVLVRDTLKLLERRKFDHVLLENVPNWRKLHRGQYLEEVISELERLGYHWAYRTIDARAFGLPQRRLRVFLYATKVDDPRSVLFQGDVPEADARRPITDCAHGFYWTEGTRGLGWGEDCVPTLKGGSAISIPSPPAILMPDGNIVTPDIRDAERLQGFAAGWTNVEHSRREANVLPFRHRRRWMQVGNAVNVGVSAWIGRQLSQRPETPLLSEELLEKGKPWPEAAWGDGKRRWRVDIGHWPVARKPKALATFLKYPPAPLSERATAGFHARISASSLRFPEGFKEAVAKHLGLMQAKSHPSKKSGRRTLMPLQAEAAE
ncbi:DNA (cytosine-5-)-methyltransferase [Bradyrhizobium sp. NBAIM14]|uniref:DNA cytosine methyltransferase n=1 Tax=Bradyrhizobium sp. NBAIM14 TaxID=2793814 RepID=UPI001CD1BC30|nr:DNA (cytosine-5-)-methyltransferase [Bradyrhizobium sp. NBAIM14]